MSICCPRENHGNRCHACPLIFVLGYHNSLEIHLKHALIFLIGYLNGMRVGRLPQDLQQRRVRNKEETREHHPLLFQVSEKKMTFYVVACNAQVPIKKVTFSEVYHACSAR